MIKGKGENWKVAPFLFEKKQVRVVKKKKKKDPGRERESRKKKTPRTNSIPKLEANIWLDKKE